MKITFPTLKKKTPALKKKFRVDARRYWVILLSAFVCLLTIELVYFSLAFLKMSARITAPATATAETNDVQIAHMKAKLDSIEKAIAERTNSPVSQ